MTPSQTPSNSQKSKSDKDEEKTQTPAEVAQAAVNKAPEPKESDPTYSHERLIRECPQAVGYDSHIIAGALTGVSESELTIKEAKAACRAWLKAEEQR